MKILSYDKFIILPAGTIFSYYAPAYCQGLYRKGESIKRYGAEDYIDFFESSLIADCWNGEEPTVDKIESRWGVYEYDQLFAVYEEADLKIISEQLRS